MADISKRIETARRAVESFRPCTMVVTMTDGTQVTTDPIGAITLFKNRAPMKSVYTDRDDYSELAGMLTALTGGCEELTALRGGCKDDAERA